MSALRLLSSPSRPRASRSVLILVAAAILSAGTLHAAGADPVKRELLKHPDPEYPAIAKQMKVAGVVMLQVTIDKGGNVTDAKVSSGSPLLSTAASSAVRHWKYTAAEEETTMFVRVVFNLP